MWILESHSIIPRFIQILIAENDPVDNNGINFSGIVCPL
jgi:hypothetical protein